MKTKAYTQEEVDQIIKCREEKIDVQVIAKEFDRTPAAVWNFVHLWKLFQTKPEEVEKISGNVYRLFLRHIGKDLSYNTEEKAKIETDRYDKLGQAYDKFQESILDFVHEEVETEMAQIREDIEFTHAKEVVEYGVIIADLEKQLAKYKEAFELAKNDSWINKIKTKFTVPAK